MTTRPRYLAGQLRRDLKRKMVFVAGPRQVGKTTLARSLPGAAAGYLNWDVAEHRERILRREHRLRPEWDNDFTIRNQADIIQTFQETQETFTLLQQERESRGS